MTVIGKTIKQIIVLWIDNQVISNLEKSLLPQIVKNLKTE
jgi:hypothetical protein